MAEIRDEVISALHQMGAPVDEEILAREEERAARWSYFPNRCSMWDWRVSMALLARLEANLRRDGKGGLRLKA